MKKITMISMILICCVTWISYGSPILQEDFDTGTGDCRHLVNARRI